MGGLCTGWFTQCLACIQTSMPGSKIWNTCRLRYWVSMLDGGFALAFGQFRDNILLVIGSPRHAWALLIEEVQQMVQNAWGVLIVRHYPTSDIQHCTGNYCGKVCKAMDMVMVWD